MCVKARTRATSGIIHRSHPNWSVQVFLFIAFGYLTSLKQGLHNFLHTLDKLFNFFFGWISLLGVGTKIPNIS